MRAVAQFGVIAVLAAGGLGAWFGWQQWQGQREAAEAQGSTLPAGVGAPLPVEVVPVRRGNVVEKAEAVGTARANESVTVTAKQVGFVASIGFEEGERVRVGQVLIELEMRERRADIDQARGDLDQARAARDDARQRMDRARQLQGSGAITQARLDELDAQFRQADARVRAAEARIRSLDARLEDVRIIAPFDGRVGLRQVSLGSLVQPGTPITTLDDVSRIKLDFAVPEVYLGYLRPGLKVLARTAAFADRVFEGEVSVIDSRVDPATRSVRVNALFDNREDVLRPGLFLSVVLVLTERVDALLVPEEAIVAEGTRHFVFAVKDGRAVRTEVRLGTRLEGAVEVVQGLAAGTPVIVRGVSRVRPNQPVAARPFQPRADS